MIKTIYYGHSFVEIQTDFGSIIIDPFLDFEWSTSDVQDFTTKNIKAIIPTHWHEDHLGLTIDIASRTGSMIIWMAELMNYLKNNERYYNIHKMNIWWEYDFGDFKVKLVNAVHSWRMPDGSYCQPCGVIIKIWDKTIYHAGDTALTYDMKLLGEYENIDLAFLPIWDNYTMWTKDAVIATGFIKPKVVIPIHYNSMNVIMTDPSEFARQVMAWNLATPKVLNPWQEFILQ